MKAHFKLLCIAPYPVEGASVRLRVLQFLPALRLEGIEAEFRPFMDSRFFQGFYKRGGLLRKSLRMSGMALRRFGDVRRAHDCDVVLIHREAMPFGPPIIETLITQQLKKPIVFDFDDAIHLPFISPTYGRLASIVKYPQKTPRTISMSRHVIAGNRHLEEYARTLNPHVSLVPTVADAARVKPLEKRNAIHEYSCSDAPTVLGWMGTHSTAPYLEALFAVVQEVARRVAPQKIVLRVVGANREIKVEGVQVDHRAWDLKRETNDLQEFDIGLYPMPDDAWTLGKSGFKAVEYMAVGIPAVCSPVGATRDIVQDGVNGFLCASAEEWIEKLCLLIENPSLRRQLGEAGRKRVEEWYCVEKQAPRVIEIIANAAKSTT